MSKEKCRNKAQNGQEFKMRKVQVCVIVDPDEWDIFVRKYKSASARIRELVRKDLEED